MTILAVRNQTVCVWRCKVHRWQDKTQYLTSRCCFMDVFEGLLQAAVFILKLLKAEERENSSQWVKQTTQVCIEINCLTLPLHKRVKTSCYPDIWRACSLRGINWYLFSVKVLPERVTEHPPAQPTSIFRSLSTVRHACQYHTLATASCCLALYD